MRRRPGNPLGSVVAIERAASLSVVRVGGSPAASSRWPTKASSRLAAPRAATSSAGAPVARMRPACISEMRSQRSASFMKWVETNIVTPCRRERSTSSSQNWSRATGSTPEVGSSRISISGSCSTATARDRRCRIPSGRSPEASSACSSRPKRAISSATRARARSRGRWNSRAWRSRLPRTESSP